MKKSFLIMLSVLLTQHVAAQNNFIGTDPFLPVFGTVSVNYERAILPRMSLGIGFGQKFSSGILEISGIDKERLKTDDLSFQGIRIVPEFRWYLSKTEKGLTGFYVGLYYKYQTNSCDVASTYTPENGSATDVDVDLDIRTNSVGLEMGYKLLVHKKFYADFLIAGVGLAKSELNAEAQSEVPDGYFDELSGEIKRFFVLKGFKPDMLNQDDKIKADFTLPSLRYGIKLGISF
ncbi:MAG: DUF3575 domain-containing protein [Sphingobacteriales bacterium]|jgi:hypothetical protein|nr:DUF3575 domain-containing protein [Sphingobacteriales bacterium]